jgi:putative alpha-1,2-mannosidase
VRDEEGNFLVARDVYDTTGCTESNIIQQSWFVPHDTPGLVALFGAQRFESTLEGFFARADFTKLWNDDYNHSNEPCHHNAYLFHYVDRPDRTQYWVRRIQKEAYRLGAFGFCGNEDVGQISAWYVLSALGFGQPCLAAPHYYMNTPLFQKASIRLDKQYHACGVDDRFTVVCNADPLEKPYIKALALNGEKLDRLYLTYDEITNGGVLEISLKKEA